MQRIPSTFQPVAATPRNSEGIDRREMLDRLGGDIELVTELVELFLEESPKLLLEVQLAVRCRDAKAIERTAHRLKTSAGRFGMNQAVKTALRLEVSGRTSDLADVDDTCQTLVKELRQLHAKLEQWCEAETTACILSRDYNRN